MGTPGGLERGSRSRGVAALSSRGVHRRRGGSGGDQPPVATGSGEQRPDRGGGVGWAGVAAAAQFWPGFGPDGPRVQWGGKGFSFFLFFSFCDLFSVFLLFVYFLFCFISFKSN